MTYQWLCGSLIVGFQDDGAIDVNGAKYRIAHAEGCRRQFFRAVYPPDRAAPYIECESCEARTNNLIPPGNVTQKWL